MLFVLSPFAAFAFLTTVTSTLIGLLAATVLSVAVLIVDAVRGRAMKTFQIVSTTVFGALALYVAFIDGHLGAPWIRMSIDGALLALALGSMAVRAPFTLQYARETVDADIAQRPEFRQANYLLTSVWSVAFVAMLIADFVTVLLPSLPVWTALATAFVVRNGAALFTQWYAKMRRDRVAAARVAAATAG